MSGGLQELRGPRPERTTHLVEPPRRWRTRVLLPALLGLIIVTLLLVTSIEALRPRTPVRVVPVVLRAVEGTSGTVTVQAPGWIEPDPYPHYVAALADGIVDRVLVLEGEVVEADQVVAHLVDDDSRLAVRRADADLGRRRSALAAALADRTAARETLEHLVERHRAAATTLARVEELTAEVVEAAAMVKVEQSKLAELRDELDRKTPLVESHAVSEAVVVRLGLRIDSQTATIEATEARRRTLAAMLTGAQADRIAAIADQTLLIEERRAVARADAAVEGAEADVALALVLRDEAALELARMSVRTSVAGVVLRRFVSPGSKLTRDGDEYAAHVMHVYDPASLQVRVDVPLADAAHVHIGQLVEITVEVLPDSIFDGHVSRIVHEADIQKNTVEVKVAIDDPSPDLKPEMLARARFVARDSTPDGPASRQKLFAPRALLVPDDDGRPSSLVITDLVARRGRVEQRVVTMGRHEIDGWVEIDDGLRAGDLLVDGSSGVRPGEKVRVIGESPLHGGSAHGAD